MAEDQSPTVKTPKGEWVKPQVALVEAGDAEFAPGRASDSYYNLS